MTNHSDGIDIIKTMNVTSLSDDMRETSKVGEILTKFVLTEPLEKQYDRPNIQYHKLYQNNQGEALFSIFFLRIICIYKIDARYAYGYKQFEAFSTT